MATNLFFADTATGETIASTDTSTTNRVRYDGGNIHAGKSYSVFDGAQWLKCSRKVIYKSNASKHKCDDRCLHATGKTMQCECSCGGKNHGKGA